MVVLSFTGFFYYWVVLGLFYAIAYRQLYLAKHAEAVRAQLDTLRAQLQPHFLFNALNSISALIADDPALANLMVVRLGDLLRNVLRHRDRHEIPLEEELELLEDYLDIQRIRFADRLEVRLDVSPVTARAMVPTMILQPLVENSIRHGIEPWVDGGIIRIGARRDGDRLVLEIADDGTRAESAGGNGVGLANTRGRMDRLYGGRYELITDAAPDGFTVTLAFPWREDAEE